MRTLIKNTLTGIFLTGFLLGLVTSAQAKDLLIGRPSIMCSDPGSPGELSIYVEAETTGDILPTAKFIGNSTEGCDTEDAHTLILQMKSLVESLGCLSGNIQDTGFPPVEEYDFRFTCIGNKKRIINVLDKLIRFSFTTTAP